MSNKPIFRQKSMTEEMRRAEGGKDVLYPVYKFSGGHTELYKDRVGGIKPRFAGRT